MVPTAPVEASRLTVCLDVGHGLTDWGYTRLSTDGSEIIAMEKDLVLQYALAIKEQLQAEGINVVLTRYSDTYVNTTNEDVNGDGVVGVDEDGNGILDGPTDASNNLDELQARVNVCNAAGADLLVSIHINGAENTALNGYEAWWAEDRPFSDQSQWFAEEIVRQFGEQFAAAGFDVESRGAYDDTKVDIPPEDQGTFQHFVMLSPNVPERNFVGSTMPGAVVEALFLSNDTDYEVLSTPEGQDAIVAAYVNAILNYFEAHPDPIANDPEPGDPILRWLPDEYTGGIAGTPAEAPTAEARATPEARATGRAEATADATEEATADTADQWNRPPIPEIADFESSAVVSEGTSGRMEIALTFDAGADRGYAAEILDVLKEYGIHASFGMTGMWAEQNPDLVKRMADEGHMIFNHTYSHASFTGYSTPWSPGDPGSEFRINEIQLTEQIISDITGGYDTKPYFRPPYGDLGPQSLQDIAWAGYGITVMWTVDSFGWKGWTAAEIAEWCISNATPGGIILMHVGASGQDYQALPAVIEELMAEGYSFVTVEQLLQP
jgi:peptidoglycan/xylan/chitin deacetylase (PgdA/CDA1 family)/N-acetylmuramoyl-L-alanine amidase